MTEEREMTVPMPSVGTEAGQSLFKLFYKLIHFPNTYLTIASMKMSMLSGQTSS